MPSFLIQNPNELKLSANGFITNDLQAKHFKDFDNISNKNIFNISAISLRSSKDSYKSIITDTAKFKNDNQDKFPFQERCLTEKNQNLNYKYKQNFLTLNSDPNLHKVYSPSFTHHKRIRSDASNSSVISKAKHNMNKIKSRKDRLRSKENKEGIQAKITWKKLTKTNKNYVKQN